MDYGEQSYRYDDNDDASFGNEEVSFGSNDEYGDHDNHSVYDHTTTYNANEHFFSIW